MATRDYSAAVRWAAVDQPFSELFAQPVLFAGTPRGLVAALFKSTPHTQGGAPALAEDDPASAESQAEWSPALNAACAEWMDEVAERVNLSVPPGSEHTKVPFCNVMTDMGEDGWVDIRVRSTKHCARWLLAMAHLKRIHLGWQWGSLQTLASESVPLSNDHITVYAQREWDHAVAQQVRCRVQHQLGSRTSNQGNDHDLDQENRSK